jgi:hypothetical protein
MKHAYASITSAQRLTRGRLAEAAALFVSVGASRATADSYNLTFQCTGTCDSIPIATNNPVSFPFPTIDVTWEGIGFNLTFFNPGPLSSLASDTYVWNGFLDDYQLFPGNPTYPVNLIFFIADSNTPSFARDEVNTAFEGPVRGEVVDTGTVVITPAPEPGSAAVTLIGIALLGFLMVLRSSRASGLAKPT